MKALSIKQPWASLIAHGIKDIENRTWKTHFRGRIFIHASAKWDERSKGNDASKLLTNIQYNSIPHQIQGLFLDQGVIVKDDEIPLSAIIGEVDIIDCVVNHHSIWAEKTPDESDLPFCRDCADNDGICPNDNKKCDEPKVKPIYNWVLANAVLYEKPILNVKGKLSFWEFEKPEESEFCECSEPTQSLFPDGQYRCVNLDCGKIWYH